MEGWKMEMLNGWMKILRRLVRLTSLGFPADQEGSRRWSCFTMKEYKGILELSMHPTLCTALFSAISVVIK